MQSSSKLEHSTQSQNSRMPMLMYEEFLHLLPILYQLACAPNCYEFGFLWGGGIMDQRSSFRIPRSPGETKDPTRSPNSETDPGTDLNHQGADHVFLDIGPVIRILQVNIQQNTTSRCHRGDSSCTETTSGITQS